MAPRALWLVGAALLAGCGEPAGDDGRGGHGFTCPPPAPYGIELGDHIEPLAFQDCDGAPVSLHDLCGASVGVVATLYGWCPPCHRVVDLVSTLQQEHAGAGMRSVIVVVEDPYGAPAGTDYCSAARAQYDAPVVVTDPTASIEAYGDNDLVIVLEGDGSIRFRRQDASLEAITTAIEAPFGG